MVWGPKPVTVLPAPEATVPAAVAARAGRGVKVEGSEAAAECGLLPDNPPLHQVERRRPT